MDLPATLSNLRLRGIFQDRLPVDVEAAGAVGTVELLAVVLVAAGFENPAYQDVRHLATGWTDLPRTECVCIGGSIAVWPCKGSQGARV